MNIVDTDSTLMDGTDLTVASTTSVGLLVFRVDVTPLQTGDTLVIWMEGKVLSGGTLVPTTTKITISGDPAEGDEIVDVEAFPNFHTLECHLQQTAGTNRTIPWELFRI